MVDLLSYDPSPDQIQALRALSIEDIAHSSLLGYAALQYQNYTVAAHNTLIAKYLMSVERGEITRLMIFTPPRHGKTLLASELFPAWYMGRNPSKQIIASTYSHERAQDVGRKVKHQLSDPFFASIFPDCHLSPDSKSSSKLSTEEDGNYFSVGIGGATTGRGAHLFLIDDPIKGRKDAESEVSQRQLRDWYTSVAYTRLMPGKSAIVLIMTRWSYYDLAGYLLEDQKHEKWTVLNLPAIAEEDDEIGRAPGDALWPSSYPVSALNRIKTTLGSRDWNALYQQRPMAEEGGMIQLDWFKRYSSKEWRAFKTALRMGVTPAGLVKSDGPMRKFAFKQIVISWDTAFKDTKLSDPSAATVWGINDKGDFFLIWVVNKKMEFPQLKREAIRIWKMNCERYSMPSSRVPILIEDKASGQSLIQELKQIPGMVIIPIKSDANKVVRFSETTATIESGRVYLPEQASWLVDFETQLSQFPYGKHDDIVDSVSQFLRWVGRPRFIKGLNAKFWK